MIWAMFMPPPKKRDKLPATILEKPLEDKAVATTTSRVVKPASSPKAAVTVGKRPGKKEEAQAAQQAEWDDVKDKWSQMVANFSASSQNHIVKPPSAAAAARASGCGSTAKKAKKTTAKASQTRPPAVHSAEPGTMPQRLVQRATVPGPRPPAVHSAEHQ